MANIFKPWLDLSPNNFMERWWKVTEIIDVNVRPNNNDIQCYFIIQDGNMCGNFWYVASWYLNCPNRYTNTLYESTWNFDKKLSKIVEGDIVTLLDNPEIKFKAYECKFAFEDQRQFCKILERIF
jgi:hypothetical protein